MREDGHAFVEARVENVGERHAAHLADDLAGDLDAGEEDVEAETEQEADERLVGEHVAVAPKVGDRRDGRVDVDRRDDERHGDGEKGFYLPREAEDGEEGRGDDQAADAREHEREDGEASDEEAFERRHGKVVIRPLSVVRRPDVLHRAGNVGDQVV